MDFVMEQLPVLPILYMRRTGAYGGENYQLMEALKKWADGQGLLRGSVIYAVAHDAPDTPPEQCRYDVCLVAAPDAPAEGPVQKGELPGGKYAVFTVPHTAEAVQGFWNSVIQVLQANGLAHRASSPILERYQYALVEDGKCEFCVPVL